MTPARTANDVARDRSVAVEVVQPGVISTATHETFPFVDSVDGSLWLPRYDDGFDDQTIFVAGWNGRAWEAPRVAPFSGRWGDRAPRFAPLGRTLFFTSNRPVDGGAAAGDMNIWVVERTGSGWGEPRALPAPVYTAGPEIHASVTPAALYLASVRDGGLGRSDIYRFPRTGSGWGEPRTCPRRSTPPSTSTVRRSRRTDDTCCSPATGAAPRTCTASSSRHSA